MLQHKEVGSDALKNTISYVRQVRQFPHTTESSVITGLHSTLNHLDST
jgi:hypothetical protein